MISNHKISSASSRHQSKGGWLALCCAVLAAFPAILKAETAASEYSVKAAIIYKIAKFVDWPEDAFSTRTEPLPLCLAESDPIGPSLDSLAGKIVWGRPLAIKRLSEISMVEADCRILFLGQDTLDSRNRLVSNVADSPVLTIGDSADFVDVGGIVTLEIEQSRVRFAINVGASERAGLNISAQLLQLATIKGEGS